jgi:Spy/CpxP family protein refolding chaperone
VKNTSLKWMLAMALVLAPAAALAQHGHAPAPGNPDPGAPPAHEAPAPDDSHADLDDEWLAFDEGGDDAMWDEAGPGGGGPEMRARGAHRAPGMRGMHGRRMRHGGPGMGIHRRFSQLDLTEAQRDKLRDVHEAAMRKGVQRRADSQLARMDLHKLMRADNPSASAVNTQIDKLAKLHAEAWKARFDTYMQARAVLTPEQLKQLQSGPPKRQRSGGSSQ